jgi:hypothetical protein
LPKIWNSYVGVEMENFIDLDFSIQRPKIDYSREAVSNEVIERSKAPDYIFFSPKVPAGLKNKLPDWFTIRGHLMIISERFHELLSNFALGATQMFEVPLYDSDEKTQRPGHWFILHVAAKKTTLIPEKSENIEPSGPESPKWARKYGAMSDILAVRAESADGEDLWVDPNFRRRLFLTDRLVSAITSAKIKIRNPAFSECRVIADQS